MTNAVTINNHSVSVREYRGQRVLTFKDIDAAHGRPSATSRRNFNGNRKHFKEGVDYFVRNSYEAKNELGITAPNGVILITQSGYLMLAKSFTDDLAWKVQRELVNTYFRATQQTVPEQLTIETAEYHYYDKQYNGQPIVGIADFEYFTGAKKSDIYNLLMKRGKLGTDYFHLDGEALAEFKRENPSFPKSSVRWYIAITRSGFIKVIKLLGLEVETPQLFLTAKPTEKPKEEYAIVLDNLVIQQRIERIRKELVTVDVLLDKYNRHNIAVADMNALRNTLGKVGMELGADISGLSSEKYRTTTNYKR